MRESPEKQKHDLSQEHPFIENLEPSRYDSRRIKELKSRPDKLVREWRVNPIKEKKDVDRRIAEMRKDMKVFDNIRDHYGIDVVKTELVLGGDRKNPKMYMVVDKIYGKNLEEIEKLPDHTAEVLDQLFASMIQYYFDIYKNGGDYWEDVGNYQIVYGHKYGEDRDNFYIVDVEPRVYNYNEHSAGQNSLLFRRFEHLIADLGSLLEQNKFTMPVKFVKSRIILKDVLKFIPESEPEYSRIRDTIRMFERFEKQIEKQGL